MSRPLPTTLALSTALLTAGPAAAEDLPRVSHAPFGPLLAQDATVVSTLDRSFALSAAGDLDGDGREELVVGHFGRSYVSIHRASGGRLGVPQRVETGRDDTTRVLLRDLDGDGDLDLLVHQGFSGDVLTAMANDGTGAFTPLFEIPCVAMQVDVRLAAGNARRLLVMDGPGRLFERPLDANGLPGDPALVTTEETTHAVALDVDGDGVEDLVTGRFHSGPGFFVRIAMPDGTWSTPQPFDHGSTSNGLVTVVDVDGDGREDLLVPQSLSTTEESIRILRNVPGAGLVPALGAPRTSSGPAFQAHAGDIDGDGIADLVAGVGSSSSFGITFVEIWRGTGDEAAPYEPVLALPSLDQPRSGLADLDGDGLADPVVGNPNDGDTSFGVIHAAFSAPGGLPGTLRSVGSANETGIARAAILDDGAGGTAPLLRSRDATLELSLWDDDADRPIRRDAVSFAGTIWSVQTTHDLDGELRRAVIVEGAPRRAWHVTVDVAAGTIEVDDAPFATDVGTVDEGDLDGDGDLDAAWTDAQGNALRLALRDESDVLVVADERPLGPDGTILAVGDLDGDGLADVAVHEFAPGGVELQARVAFGEAGAVPGALSKPVLYARRSISGGIRPDAVVHDWDGDGRRELLATGAFLGLPSLVHVTDAGTVAVAPYATGPIELDERRLEVGAGDVDGDGVPDLVVEDVDAATVLVGTGSGPDDAPALDLVALPLNVRSEFGIAAAAHDVDGDARADVVLQAAGPRVFVLLQRPPAPSCLGDLDADGDVDFEDLLRQLVPIGPEYASPGAFQDLDGDFDRDVDDLMVLLANWGPCDGG